MPQADSRVEVYLCLETYFESRKIRLDTAQSEEDAQALKAKLSSAEVNYVLKCALLWAASCLVSRSDTFQKMSKEVLDDIEVLERLAQPAVDHNSTWHSAPHCQNELLLSVTVIACAACVVFICIVFVCGCKVCFHVSGVWFMMVSVESMPSKRLSLFYTCPVPFESACLRMLPAAGAERTPQTCLLVSLTPSASPMLKSI